MNQKIENLQAVPSCPDDKFAIGHSKEMDILSSIYPNLPKIIEVGMEEYRVYPSIHYMMKFICEENKIQLARSPYIFNVYYKCAGLRKEGSKNSLTSLRKVHKKKKKKGKK